MSGLKGEWPIGWPTKGKFWRTLATYGMQECQEGNGGVGDEGVAGRVEQLGKMEKSVCKEVGRESLPLSFRGAQLLKIHGNIGEYLVQ